MRWFWGFLFLLIGIVLLGNNLAWWHPVNLASLWVYWPLILIILGVAAMTRHWRYNYLIMVLIVLASLGFVYFAEVTGRNDAQVNSNQIIKTEIVRDAPDTDKVKKAKITIDSGAVNVKISGSTDKLVSGSFESSQSKPTIKENINGDTIEYTIKTDKSYESWGSGQISNSLDLELSKSIPIELKIDAKASNLNLDLKDLTVNSLSISSGASNLNLILGNNIAKGAVINIDSGASKLDIKAPQSIGVAIRAQAPLSANNFDNLEHVDNKYYTNNFASAENKISLVINAGASEIHFESY